MKVLNLRCAHDHRFEGWFASEDDYRGQLEGGLLYCPVCGDPSIARLPSAPRISVARSRGQEPERREEARSDEAAKPAVTPAPAPAAPGAMREMAMQAVWLQAVRHVMANTHDVGDRFAEEARRIHYGESEERAIRGQATREEAEALREEGIEVVALPVPAALKGPLQ
jgi:hypothetical protein